MTPAEWATVVAAIAGALGVRELLGRLTDRRRHAAETNQVQTGTRKDEVAILREVLDEVRADSQKKDVRLDELSDRVSLLEERERHALTRAAVHEAWDQMAFAFILTHNPDHPPPPPLTMGDPE